MRVEGLDLGQVVGQQGWQIGLLPQAGNALAVLGMLLRLLGVQGIGTGTGMGVDQAPGLVLGVHVAQHGHQGGVLEHIGVVAGMEGVAVGEHGPALCHGQQPRWRTGRTTWSTSSIVAPSELSWS